MTFIKNILNFLRLYKVSLRIAYAILIIFIILVLNATTKSNLMETISIFSPVLNYFLSFKFIQYPIGFFAEIFCAQVSENVSSIYPTVYYILLVILLLIIFSLLIIKFVSPLLIAPMFGVIAYMCRYTLLNYHKQNIIIYSGLGKWIEVSRVLTTEEKIKIVNVYFESKYSVNAKIISWIDEEHFAKFIQADTRQEIEKNVEQYLEAEAQTQASSTANGLPLPAPTKEWTSYLPETMINHPWLTIGVAVGVTVLIIGLYIIFSGKGNAGSVSNVDTTNTVVPQNTDHLLLVKPGQTEHELSMAIAYADSKQIWDTVDYISNQLADRTTPLCPPPKGQYIAVLPRNRLELPPNNSIDEPVVIKFMKGPEHRFTIIPPEMEEIFNSGVWKNHSFLRMFTPEQVRESQSICMMFNKAYNPNYSDLNLNTFHYNIGDNQPFVHMNSNFWKDKDPSIVAEPYDPDAPISPRLAEVLGPKLPPAPPAPSVTTVPSLSSQALDLIAEGFGIILIPVKMIGTVILRIIC